MPTIDPSKLITVTDEEYEFLKHFANGEVKCDDSLLVRAVKRSHGKVTVTTGLAHAFQSFRPGAAVQNATPPMDCPNGTFWAKLLRDSAGVGKRFTWTVALEVDTCDSLLLIVQTESGAINGTQTGVRHGETAWAVCLGRAELALQKLAYRNGRHNPSSSKEEKQSLLTAD